ncbi:DUF1120 domain-containing protein [Paraburkholderia sartisoli]|uniref:Pilin (Type 1 fimbria component protein) n=1 Tax=Paraburkholderia sartisoli TaxID=83784 RepID=A0A1H4G406_9BURK|nr:DUF1120 domain-containing protein [Paraburkholderia sartisoli]SEB04315.1 Protein of unknown function [Paraburkholderia sartisoli]
MKIVSKNTLLACMLAAASCGAFAVESVDLKITGTIVPPSCTPTLSGGGTVDFGRIPAASLSATAFKNAGTKTTTLNLTCDAPTRVALQIIDDRSGTTVPGLMSTINGYLTTDPAQFGLGSVSGKNIGSYTMFLQTPNVMPGSYTGFSRSANNGASWVSLGQNFRMTAGNLLSWSNTNGGTPVAITSVTQRIDVQVGLNKTGNLPDLKQEVPLDGMATFSVVYL